MLDIEIYNWIRIEWMWNYNIINDEVVE